MKTIGNHIPQIIAAALLILCALAATAQRKITPVNTPQTATQPVNEFAGDTARLNAIKRASMKHYHDEHGNIIYVDTVTGREWRDTAAANVKLPMIYPLLESATVGVDIWNPVMRAFGQHYGLIDFSAQVSLHNRYKPTFEAGLGMASNTPAGFNFTYKSPLSAYFRIGMDYNFLYNANTTDYQYFAGIRVGCSPFTYSLEDISITSSYWDETAHPVIPSQHSFVTWWELTTGIKVKIIGPVSAGWTFRFHNILHEGKNKYGRPWYIPGYGARGGKISGSISIYYTLALNKKPVLAPIPTETEILLPTPETDDPYAPGITDANSMREQATPPEE